MRGSLALFSILVVIAGAGSAAAYDGDVKGYLSRVYVKANLDAQRLEILIADTAGNRLIPCGSAGDKSPYARLPSTSPALDQILSVAIAAHLSGRRVQVKSDWNASTQLCEIKQLGLVD